MNEMKPDSSDHPRGTLAIIAVYALLFLAGWITLYFFIYQPRGPVLP